MKKKILVPAVASLMLLSGVMGGTLAYLMDTTNAVENTFTVGNVSIGLSETTGSSYKMVPATVITKDPKATIKADSEASWLFVQIDESTDKDFDEYMTYAIADGWDIYYESDAQMIIYRKVDATTADTDFAILKDNEVKVKAEVTKEMMEVLTENNYPKLTFKAYAIQQAGIADATTAWTTLNPTTSETTEAATEEAAE